MASFEIDDHDVLAALARLTQTVQNPRPALREIGQVLVESTKHRFELSPHGSTPDGSDWLLNSVLSTLLYKEGDRPLTGETGKLMDTISYHLLGNDGLEIGSPMEYAAMQQFGGTKAEFPKLWGDIPARPFLGLSDTDRTDLLTILQSHIEDTWR